MSDASAQWSGPHSAALREAVRRIVDVARPESVVLFGSRAEGRADAQSDFDLMVIADTADAGAVSEDISVALADMSRGRWHDFPCFDVVVYTPQEYRHESSLPGLLAHRVARRGVSVYGRAE